MTFKMSIFLWAAVSTCIFCAGCGGSSSGPGGSVASMVVERGAIRFVIPAFGELQSVKSTPIQVPQEARGRQTIAWMVPENTLVEKGETVVRLDNTWYKEQIQRETYKIDKLELEISEKKAALAKEAKDLQGELDITTIEEKLADLYGARDETLYSRNEIIEAELDLGYLKKKKEHFEKKKGKLEQKALAELQLLQLKKKTSRMKVDQYQNALNAMEIKAPNDGVFIYNSNWRGDKTRIGQSVWTGSRLGKLPELENMEAKVFVLESEAAGLKEGLLSRVQLDALPGRQFNGKVKGLDTIAKPLNRESPLKYFQVKVSLDKTDTAVMKPGSQVTATIFVKEEDGVLAVPNQALFSKDEKYYVHVKSSSGIEERNVAIGFRSLTRTVIAEGLQEGETVLLGSGAEPGKVEE